MQEHLFSNQQPFTLYELNVLIQSTLDAVFYGKYFWVKAEIHKLNVYKYSGHAYPELLEKRENEVICQMRSIIWKSDLIKINQKFLDTIGEPLKENINALMLVSVKFDPKYGLSLQIKDIDPNYTLGELEKQKKEAIEKLKAEKIFDKNKQLTLNIVPQKLAIISVETSKGYRDLITTFQKYEHQFQIIHDLYPSLLQGEEAAQQMTEQLKNIKNNYSQYDAVLIIRGGGGEVGLSCFNDYELCKTIATFPIPVITGIGHSTNFTVAEMVAYHNGITPTDTAMFIIQKFENFQSQLSEFQKTICQLAENFLTEQKNFILDISKSLSLLTKEVFHQQKLSLLEFQSNLKISIFDYINAQKKVLQFNEYHIKQAAQTYLSFQDKKLQAFVQNLQHLSYLPIKLLHQKLNSIEQQIHDISLQNLQYKKMKLENLEKNIQLLHPANILKRGFAIVFNQDNQIIKNAFYIKENDKIKIKFHSNELEGNITQLKINYYEK